MRIKKQRQFSVLDPGLEPLIMLQVNQMNYITITKKNWW